MDPSEVIETLKSRSGRSLKVRVVALKQLVFQAQIFFLVIFANENCRVGLLMRNTEKDDRRVSVESSFFLNNLQHIDTHHDIPVFKLSSSSSTKLSNKPVLNYLPIDDETLNTIAAAINIADYVPNVGPLPPPAAGPVGQPGPQGPLQNTLSLYQFCVTNPAFITDQQHVEFLVLGSYLAGARESFTGAYYKIVCCSL